MLKLNAPAEIHWRRSNMNTRDPILMKSVEVLKDCRSLNAAAEMNCPMPRSVEKVPIRNEKRCISRYVYINAAVGDNGHVPVITKIIVERRKNVSDIVVTKQRCYLVSYEILRAFK